MTRFLTQLFAFLLVQAAVFALLLARYDTSDSANYLAQTVEKNRLLRRAGPGKLVIVGGSSATFGLASDRLESALNRPVVNLGLASGVGVEFMLAEVKPALREGDVVLFSLEYDHFARGTRTGLLDTTGFDPEILRQVLEFRPAGVACLAPLHLRKVVLDRGLELAGDIARRGLRSWASPTAATTSGPMATASAANSTRRGFNRWGDFVAHRDPALPPDPIDVAGGRFIANPRQFPHPTPLRRLRSFASSMSARGVRVIWSFTPRPETDVVGHAELVGRLESELRRIPGLRVLDSPLDQAYPRERFYGTANHLDGEGARLRTDRIIAALRPILEDRSGTPSPGR